MLATAKHQLEPGLHLVNVRLLELGQRSLEVKVLRRHGHRHRRGRPGRRRAARRAVCLLLQRLRDPTTPSGAPATAAAPEPRWAAASPSAAPAAPAAAAAGPAVAPASPPALSPACEQAAQI